MVRIFKDKKQRILQFISILLLILLTSCKKEQQKVISKDDGDFIAYKTDSPILIDGFDKEHIWAKSNWYNMNYIWMGNQVDITDYNGKFKLAWDNQKLYILVEVVDNYLQPTLANGKENYWKGDYVEVFIDEDASGGNHKFNHQAFAYHVSTEGRTIDKNTQQQTVFFDDHIEVKRTKERNKYLWEMAIKFYDNTFDENATTNIPVTLIEQKNIGFSIAYGDNDGKGSRENFMGSKKYHGQNNDEGYINSDVFGSILLLK